LYKLKEANVADERKGINIKSDDISIDSQGRVVIANPEFKAAIENQKQSGKKAAILGDVNCASNC
jgi:hypothetical protein